MMARRIKSLVLVVCFLGLVLLPLFAKRGDPRMYTGGRSRDTMARSTRNTSTLGQILGEVRTSMSDMMFMKTERYLHSGVAYVQHHEGELLTVERIGADVEDHQSEVGLDHDHEHGEDHDDEVDHRILSNCVHCQSGKQTLIPTAAQDYRGVIGNLHRAVKPWRDPSKPHLHTDGTELLPWFRVMTLNDPHYIMGYAIGGWWVAQHDREASLSFLEEGIRKNPEAFQIWLTRGLLYLRKFRYEKPQDPAMLELARRDVEQAAELGVVQRPVVAEGALAEEQPGWSVFQEEDLWTACQLRVILENEHGEPDMAREWARKYIVLFPDNAIFASYANTEDRLE